jgi:hypothetical protein
MFFFKKKNQKIILVIFLFDPKNNVKIHGGTYPHGCYSEKYPYFLNMEPNLSWVDPLFFVFWWHLSST